MGCCLSASAHCPDPVSLPEGIKRAADGSLYQEETTGDNLKYLRELFDDLAEVMTDRTSKRAAITLIQSIKVELRELSMKESQHYRDILNIIETKYIDPPNAIKWEEN
jgi:hypothetical protein